MRTVNPDRTRRYLQRTMTEPPASYVLTAQEREEHAQWESAWIRNESEPPTPPFVEWRQQVAAYCKAKGLRLSMTIDGYDLAEGTATTLPQDGTYTLRWMVEESA